MKYLADTSSFVTIIANYIPNFEVKLQESTFTFNMWKSNNEEKGFPNFISTKAVIDMCLVPKKTKTFIKFLSIMALRKILYKVNFKRC